MSQGGCLVVSIVSHGHGEQVQRLLEQLASESAAHIARVVVTHNIPEPELRSPPGGWPFELQILWNCTPRGFGANHNQALKGAKEPFVCILNPDVELINKQEPFAALLQTAAMPTVGCAYPQQVDEVGRSQDCTRELPTPRALWRRWVHGHVEQRVDWVNAACIVLPQSAWNALRGFDETYFMYCEDVDLCLRLRLQGLTLRKSSAQVLHTGQRASHRQLRHLLWHVHSLLRLWMSLAYRRMRE